MLSWDDFDKNEEIKKEEPVENKIIEKFKVSNNELEVFTALRKWKDNF